ncbi:GATA zinc finger domain-containing protein 15-like [Drosophila obscura]|uniref:GATA zinc finger domain-containing protein 15-like n=1 Tax=Drosophila obscura TaxID=7282 RepID=UPI001BB22357|nr:GATA zinc finger domain-containing protein 15-like [Drosophila obscura]
MPEILNAMEMEAPSEIVDISDGAAQEGVSPAIKFIKFTDPSTNTNNNTNNVNNNNNNNNNTNNNTEVETELGPGELQLQQLHQQQLQSLQLQQQQHQLSPHFVTIPLLERRRRSRSHSHCRIAPLAPIICIQNGSHPEELVQLSRSRSCFLRVRKSFAKLFGKIMGSNNPSEADRYDYYDCE